MTEEEIVSKYQKQHLDNYKKAVIEIIKNNTEGLMKDIFSLIDKPPLDSMDTIKTKLLTLAKKEKMILNTINLNKITENFRQNLKTDLCNLENIRQDSLMEIVNKFVPERETQTICIDENKLSKINKQLKKYTKKQLNEKTSNLEIEISSIYTTKGSDSEKKNLQEQFLKYMKNSYQKQLLESIDMKIMIKDRTLCSGINEQGERYLFTKNNSRLFDIGKSTIK